MSRQYDEYLREHIGGVRKAAQWMKDNLAITEELSRKECIKFDYNVIRHDFSKYDSEEYDAYDAYFYGERDNESFNRAWLHHIHNNPHHWQHWVLINDDEGVIALEMPKLYALEMIADWWSFSWRGGNLYEVFNWYENHKDVMVLHPNTRKFVEGVLGEIKAKLEER